MKITQEASSYQIPKLFIDGLVKKLFDSDKSIVLNQGHISRSYGVFLSIYQAARLFPYSYNAFSFETQTHLGR